MIYIIILLVINNTAFINGPAVKEFQKKAKLPVTGIVDKATFTALKSK